ncbi:hypothetical protein [Desulfurispira natronophila]|uniref:Uncharacterized protein n=1 Tax=Desulfurispira natronophila TaxID=682562 RepID=A0A7W7Y5Y4_9BACT|nr:hypothetical protein [Desulfurispira natronophila]MBB5022706.1 hypothetical protein [Desulfurispira natronophila]
MNIPSSIASILGNQGQQRAGESILQRSGEALKAQSSTTVKESDPQSKAENISTPSVADKIHKLSPQRVMSLLDPSSPLHGEEGKDSFSSLINFPPAGASDKLLSAWEKATGKENREMVESLQMDFSLEQTLANLRTQGGMIQGEKEPGDEGYRDMLRESDISMQQVSERVIMRLEVAREFSGMKVEEYSVKKFMTENFQRELSRMGIF